MAGRSLNKVILIGNLGKDPEVQLSRVRRTGREIFGGDKRTVEGRRR